MRKVWDGVGWDGEGGYAPQPPSPFSRARGSNFLLGLFSRPPYYLSPWHRLMLMILGKIVPMHVTCL